MIVQINSNPDSASRFDDYGAANKPNLNIQEADEPQTATTMIVLHNN